jgi:hypothetical protein
MAVDGPKFLVLSKIKVLGFHSVPIWDRSDEGNTPHPPFSTKSADVMDSKRVREKALKKECVTD